MIICFFGGLDWYIIGIETAEIQWSWDECFDNEDRVMFASDGRALDLYQDLGLILSKSYIFSISVAFMLQDNSGFI